MCYYLQQFFWRRYDNFLSIDLPSTTTTNPFFKICPSTESL